MLSDEAVVIMRCCISDELYTSSMSQILGRGFHETSLHKQFDSKLSTLTTHWCCRSPTDMERFNATRSIDLRIIPVDRDPSAHVFQAVYGTGYRAN